MRTRPGVLHGDLDGRARRRLDERRREVVVAGLDVQLEVGTLAGVVYVALVRDRPAQGHRCSATCR